MQIALENSISKMPFIITDSLNFTEEPMQIHKSKKHRRKESEENHKQGKANVANEY